MSKNEDKKTTFKEFVGHSKPIKREYRDMEEVVDEDEGQLLTKEEKLKLIKLTQELEREIGLMSIEAYSRMEEKGIYGPPPLVEVYILHDTVKILKYCFREHYRQFVKKVPEEREDMEKILKLLDEVIILNDPEEDYEGVLKEVKDYVR